MDDYESMVQTLLKPISLELRRVILRKLTAINEEMIAKSKEIDLDDLIDDIENPEDELDAKLANIVRLQQQIVETRRKRKGLKK